MKRLRKLSSLNKTADRKSELEKDLYYGEYDLSEALINTLGVNEVDAIGCGGDSDIYIVYSTPDINKFSDFVQDQDINNFNLVIKGTSVDNENIKFKVFLKSIDNEIELPDKAFNFNIEENNYYKTKD